MAVQGRGEDRAGRGAEDPAEAKRALRERIAPLRRAIAPEQALAAGKAAVARVLGLFGAEGPERVALYAALPDELPTRPLFEALVARGTPRLLPRVTAEGGLAFREVSRWQELEPGPFGVLEPAAGPAESLGAGDVVVVPGVAFDPAGWRLGRGRGYYDRAFPPGRAPAPTLIGFGYELQVVDAVPHDSRDRRMDAIVTERRVRWTGRKPA